jgi:hypothetical protein
VVLGISHRVRITLQRLCQHCKTHVRFPRMVVRPQFRARAALSVQSSLPSSIYGIKKLSTCFQTVHATLKTHAAGNAADNPPPDRRGDVAVGVTLHSLRKTDNALVVWRCRTIHRCLCDVGAV